MKDLLDTKAEGSDDLIFTACWEATNCPRSDYLACAAFQQRKNCYEMDRVICCVKHRDNCPTCPVYIALNKVPIQQIKVHICTDHLDITGTLHIPVGARLSDYLNKTERQFLFITDARVTSVGQSTKVRDHRFAMVNRDHVILAHPLDE